MEEAERKPFRNAHSKSDRKRFDEMFDIPRLYISAWSYAVQPVRFYPILMSIMLYCYEQLSDCISPVDQIDQSRRLRKAEEEHSPPQSKLFDF